MKKHDSSFIKNVERLINPIEVGTIHFIQAFNNLLPKGIQQRLVKSSAQKYPYMGFVVEPYSSFLCYEIVDQAKAEKLIPDGFKLIKTKIFDNDEPKFYAIFGSFRAHTSAFWGTRLEFYIIAENQETGLLTWVIVDYDSNTIGHDQKNGLRDPSSSSSVVTINHRGTIFVDIEPDDKSRKLEYELDVETGRMRGLDQRLWLEGNLSVAYGRDLSENDPEVFGLRFEECEVEKALDLPLESLNIQSNTWFPGLIADVPSQVVCFPYAQHFVSDSPGHTSQISDAEQLREEVANLDFSRIEVFSAGQFRRIMLLGSFVSVALIILLVFLLVVN